MLVLVMLFLYWGSRSYLGYCGDMRLSDSERIRIAVARYMNSPHQIGVDGDLRPYYKYRSVEEFLEVNKNCCSIVGSGSAGEDVSKIDRLFGKGVSLIKIYFKRQFVVDGKVEEGPYVTIYANVTNCGKAW